MSNTRPFPERAGQQFATPGEAVDALLTAEARLPDPTVLLSASWALKAAAQAYQAHLRDDGSSALYSPVQVAEFLRDTGDTLRALATAITSAWEIVQLARCGDRIPDDARQSLDEGENALGRIAATLTDAGYRTAATARRLDTVVYTGPTGCGTAEEQ